MRPGLVNERSNHVLGPIAGNPTANLPNALAPCNSNPSDQQENFVIPQDVVRVHRASSRVWSDIRGALKAIGKSQDR